MKVLITGANGFLGKNLQLHMAERRNVEAVCFTRAQNLAQLPTLLRGVDFIFHLAGVNRPIDPTEFVTNNSELTTALVQAVETEMHVSGRKIPILFASSTQARFNNPYGASKRASEVALQDFAKRGGVPTYVFRLPNVFGKWSRPNYNSVVATFCNNIARGLPIQINDPAALLTLVYIDDVLARFIELMDGADPIYDVEGFDFVTPQYTISVGELSELIISFRNSRDTLMTECVGSGLVRALYSTYLSYLPPELFAYKVPMHLDARGAFVEILKTPGYGQVSYFTAHPGVTRGGHYHHSKTEKFLVIRGQARFKFRHMDTGETYELLTSYKDAEIVESVPGWTHDITNIGSDEMVVVLWANELFDRKRPDTFSSLL
jgi:UDP-2-acetamido-2,6-beta-L-arabino-hexul-4-ose reductase